MRNFRSKMDIATSLLTYVLETIGAYAYDIFKKVRKGPQITTTVESKEEIHPNGRSNQQYD